MCDKFRGVEEVTITGCEKTVLEYFGCEGAALKDIHDVGMQDADGLDEGEGEFVYEDTLYNIALRTYWDLRQQQPTWVPPIWRVWGVDEPRRRGVNQRVQMYGSITPR